MAFSHLGTICGNYEDVQRMMTAENALTQFYSMSQVYSMSQRLIYNTFNIPIYSFTKYSPRCYKPRNIIVWVFSNVCLTDLLEKSGHGIDVIVSLGHLAHTAAT